MATIPTVVRYSPEGLRVIVNAHEAETWEAQGFTADPPEPAAPQVPAAPPVPAGEPAEVGAVSLPNMPRAAHKGPRAASPKGDVPSADVVAKLADAARHEPPGPVNEATIA